MAHDLLQSGRAQHQAIDLVTLSRLVANWGAAGARHHDVAVEAQACGIAPGISRQHLRLAGLRRFAIDYYSPSPYAHFFNPQAPSKQSSLVLRAGSTMSVQLNGHAATAYIDQVRRVTHQGRPQHVKITLVVDTAKLPCTLERETNCTCLYCGTEPRSNEHNCRSCGAALPNC
jgi:hypothetical protein